MEPARRIPPKESDELYQFLKQKIREGRFEEFWTLLKEQAALGSHRPPVGFNSATDPDLGMRTPLRETDELYQFMNHAIRNGKFQQFWICLKEQLDGS